MYVGVPADKRRRRHKHSRSDSRDSDEEDRPSKYTNVWYVNGLVLNVTARTGRLPKR